LLDHDVDLSVLGVPMSSWRTAIVVLAALLVLWAVLVALLLVAARRDERRVSLRDAMRLVPDIVRLLRRLAADATLPRGVRVRLVLLFAYLALPFDLVPDFIPVIGYADDVVVVALVLRSVTKAAGPQALERHWPGTAQGLDVVKQLAGVAT
jgi:uncharacterized membrane protein YkvA (DUF1232 family)